MIRLETTLLGADNRDRFAENDLIVRVVEDAGEVDFFEGAGAVISDLSCDFNQLLTTKALRSLNFDRAEGEVADVGFGFFGAGSGSR